MVLKKIRQVLAIISFVLLTFFFLDFTRLIPVNRMPLADIQFVPALLAHSLIITGILLLMTLLFGRIYCSVICPLGIFQDLIYRIGKRIRPKKKNKYSGEKRILRLLILALTIISFFSGLTIILSILDPYSAYGRISTHLFSPVYVASNNVLSSIFNHFGNYTFYNVEIISRGLVSILIAVITFLTVTILAALYGRTWCNTVCPVGTILGYLSKLSFLKIQIDETVCTSCGKCEKDCKASCIDSKNKIVDSSRCVACFDCIGSCKRNGVSYKFVLPAREKADNKKNSSDSFEKADTSRRTFLTVLATASLLTPVKSMAEGAKKLLPGVSYKKKHPLSPPGSISAEHLLKHCTACHLCVSKCPSRILKPALLEYGAGGIMQPRMDFEHGFCNFDCTVCSEVCPNDALKPLTIEQKHSLQMGHVVFVINNCVVYRDETNCGACSEHCPTQAVKMVPYKNGLTIPQVDTKICVGCGGCEYVCPALPVKAIYVEGNPVQLKAEKFKEEKVNEVEINDFGF